MATQLDANQVLQNVYDEGTNTLRTSGSTVGGGGGTTEVIISDVDDSIKIGNGSGNYAAVNSDGSFNVVDISLSGTNVSVYGSQSSVASGVNQDIATYTVPAGKTFYFCQAIASGTATSEYTILVDNVITAKQRSSITDFNCGFDFQSQGQGYALTAGQIIKVVGKHTET